MLRFVAIFAVLALGLFAAELTPPAQEWVVGPWTEGVARAAAFSLTVFDSSVIASGRLLVNPWTGQGVSIEAGCNGLEAVIVLTAAMIAFPAPWPQRAMGIAVGGVAVQLLNLVRIGTLYYLARWNTSVFEWVHLYLWQPLIMLDVLVVWLLWLNWVRRGPHAR
jgi:exosortase H (IPTLxxWG-CTERM-specific)